MVIMPAAAVDVDDNDDDSDDDDDGDGFFFPFSEETVADHHTRKDSLLPSGAASLVVPEIFQICKQAELADILDPVPSLPSSAMTLCRLASPSPSVFLRTSRAMPSVATGRRGNQLLYRPFNQVKNVHLQRVRCLTIGSANYPTGVL